MRLRRPLPEGQARILKTEKRPAGMAGLLRGIRKALYEEGREQGCCFQ